MAMELGSRLGVVSPAQPILHQLWSLDKLLNLFEPKLPHLENGEIIIHTPKFGIALI